jgi:hypothetical protein
MTPPLEPLPASCSDEEPRSGTVSLSAEEQAQHAADLEDPWFRGFVTTCLDMERRGLLERPRETGDAYGDDWARELADLEAGRHPSLPAR